MKAQGFEPVLTGSRYCFLKRTQNLTPKQGDKLADLLKYDLRTVRAYCHKEAFDAFWTYKSAYWANWYLKKWCTRVMRSQLPPMKKFVATLRNHEELIMNYFKTKERYSSGIVEGLNLRVNLTMRKSFGFKSFPVMETALYHQLGHLPEPEFAHRFC
jgi:transposase